MKDNKLVNFLIEKLLKDKKLIIYGFGTFRIVPGRKGKYYNIHEKRETTEGKRHWRITFTPCTALKNLLKFLDLDEALEEFNKTK